MWAFVHEYIFSSDSHYDIKTGNRGRSLKRYKERLEVAWYKQ